MFKKEITTTKKPAEMTPEERKVVRREAIKKCKSLEDALAIIKREPICDEHYGDEWNDLSSIYEHDSDFQEIETHLCHINKYRELYLAIRLIALTGQEHERLHEMKSKLEKEIQRSYKSLSENMLINKDSGSYFSSNSLLAKIQNGDL